MADDEEVTPPEPTEELLEKRRLRTKIKVIRRRERSKAEYKHVKVVVDGEQRAISQASKFFLDNLIADDDVLPEE